jgi:hypothetical protein
VFGFVSLGGCQAKRSFERIFNVMHLILVKLSGILSKNI